MDSINIAVTDYDEMGKVESVSHVRFDTDAVGELCYDGDVFLG